MGACSHPMGILVASLAVLLVATSAQTTLSQAAPVTGALCACTVPSSQACQDAIQARCDKPDPALAEACTQMASFALSGAAKPAQSLTKYLQENCKMQPPSKASACACAAGSDAPECVNAGWFACINGNSLCHGMMLGQKAPPEAITRLAKYIGDKCSQDLGVNNVDMNFTDISAADFNKDVAPGVLQSLSNITGVPPYMITPSLTSLDADGNPLTPGAAANGTSSVQPVPATSLPATGLPGGQQLAPGAGAAGAGATAGPGALAAADPNATAADKGIAQTQAMGFGHRKLLQGGGVRQAVQRQVAKQVGKQVVKYAIRSMKNKQAGVGDSLSTAAANNGAGFQKAFSYYGVKANPTISVNGAPAVGGPAAAATPAAAGAAQAAAATAGSAAAAAPAVAKEAAKSQDSKMSSGAVAGLIIGCFFAALLLGAIPLLLCMGCWRKSIEASPAVAKVLGGKPYGSGNSSSGSQRLVLEPASSSSGSMAVTTGASVAAVGVGTAAAAAKVAHGSAADRDVQGVRDTGDQSTSQTPVAVADHASKGVMGVTRDSPDAKTHVTLTDAGATGAGMATAGAPTSSARQITHDDVYMTATDNLAAGDVGGGPMPMHAAAPGGAAAASVSAPGGAAAASVSAAAGTGGTRGPHALAEGTSSGNEEAAVKEGSSELARSDSRPSLFSRMMGLD